MLKNDGIMTSEELARILPSEARMNKGPVAIIECVQDIPCDPCVAACPTHAITMKDGIADRPHLNEDACTGCSLCVAKCPGLAIFIVNRNYSKSICTITMPYELLPIPEKGDKVTALDRAGKAVCETPVIKIIGGRKFDHTHVVTIEVPKEQAMTVRAIRVEGRDRI